MAKALLGYMSSDLRNPARLTMEKLAGDKVRPNVRWARYDDEARKALAVLRPPEPLPTPARKSPAYHRRTRRRSAD